MIHPIRCVRHFVAPLVGLVVLVASPRARAAPAELSVIRVEEGLAYIEVGRKQGVQPGQALEVVAREGNDEPFHLGWIVLESCGESVSMAHVPQELLAYVKLGVVLRLPNAAAAAAAPSPAAHTPPAAPPPTATPHPVLASAPVPAAPSPPAPTTRGESLEAAVAAPSASHEPAPHAPPIGVAAVTHQAPTTLAPPGVPLTLSVYVPAPLGSPLLMYRLAGEHVYRALAFKPQPDSYFIAAIPASAVQAPGIEYYIVVDTPAAPRQLAFASPEEPQHVMIEGRFNETNELARYGVRDEISTTDELITYAAPGGHDYYYRLEGEYLHRIFKTVYSMRFGAGYLSGQAYDNNNMLTPVGFLYAYTEAELRSSAVPFAFIPRLIFGVDKQGVGGGFEARIRVGDELGMNFEGGVTVLSQLGFDTFTALTVHPTVRLAVALAAYLENLPLADALGFRMYSDLRYRIRRATWVTLRLGAAARNINNIGPDTGVGLALGF